MPKKNNDASEIPALEREIWSKKNVPVALAACLGCEHWDDWTGCPERCEHVKRRLVHELRKQAAALQETLSKCQQEDLVRVLACRVYEYVPSPVIERQRECQRRYVEKNKDKIKAYQQEYYRAKKAREAGGEGKAR